MKLLRNLLIGSLLLSLAGSIWGAMFIAVRLTVGVITPVALVWLRYGVALFARFCAYCRRRSTGYEGRQYNCCGKTAKKPQRGCTKVFSVNFIYVKKSPGLGVLALGIFGSYLY